MMTAAARTPFELFFSGEGTAGIDARQGVDITVAGKNVRIQATEWRYENLANHLQSQVENEPQDAVVLKLLYKDVREVKNFLVVADLGPEGLTLSDLGHAVADVFGDRADKHGTWLSDFLPAGPDLRLTYLGATIDGNKMVSDLLVRVDLGGGTISLVPDFLAIQNLTLQLAAEYPLDDTRASLALRISGTLRIGEITLSVTLSAKDETLLRRNTPLDSEQRQVLADALAASHPQDGRAEEEAAAQPERTGPEVLRESLDEAADVAEHAPPAPFARYTVSGTLLLGFERDAEGALVPGRQQEPAPSDFLHQFGLADAGLGAGARIAEADFFYDGWTGDYALTLGIGGTIADWSPTTGSDRALSADPRRGPAFEIITGKLTIDTLLMEIRGSSENGAIEGIVRGELHVGDAMVELEASCSTATGGLTFSGGWTRQDPRVSDLERTKKGLFEDSANVDATSPYANPEPLGGTDLDKFLDETFGVKLDDTLKSLQIDEIGLTIRTAEQAFHFEIDGHMQLALGEGSKIGVEASVRIDIHKDSEGFVGRFQGVVVVRPEGEKGAAFELDLEILREQGATALLAGFRDTTLGESDEQDEERNADTEDAGDAHNTDGPDEGQDDAAFGPSIFDASHPSALAALARTLGYDTLASTLGGDNGLMLAVREFFVATRSEDGTDARASVIGVDVAAGLDFTRIDPPDLPLIGVPDLSGMPRLGLHLKAAYQTGSGDRAALADFADRGGYNLPQGDGDLLIQAVVRIGEGKLSSVGPPLDKADLGKVDPDPPPPTTVNGAPKGVTLGTDATWLPIQRSFGPVSVRRIGLSLSTSGPQGLEVMALLDAGLVLGGLSIGLEGLSVTSPICAVTPRFGLEGLSIDYSTPTFEIGGALLLHGDEFAGDVVVRAEQITITGNGAFRTLADPATGEKHPSFFASAVVSYPLGGPAFFFVEGFSGAFGYNRSVAVPRVEDVLSFPLVRQAAEAAEGNSGGSSSEHDFAAIPAVLGENFVAVGLQFTSFKLISSAAVLLERSGSETEIALLGVSTFRNPPRTPATALADPIAYLRVLWEAVFRPARGTFELRADIAEGAFVLDRRCRISGGLALCCWFADDPQSEVSAGEFVLTLGGYHPNFRVPAAFPRVAPLQLHWQVNENLTIKGSAFFALTSGAIMAGGVLRASWTSDNLKASFSAEAAFLAMWRPHHYEATIAVGIHAEAVYTAVFTYHLSFDAAARLEVWGPDFSGTAMIDVHILGFDVSFGISFGDTPRVARAIGWAEFQDTILSGPLASLQPVSGLLNEDDGSLTFDRHEISLAVPMALPCRTLHLGDQDVLHERTFTKEFGIVPVGIETLETHVQVEVRDRNGQNVTERFVAEPILKEGPAALWASQEADATSYGTFVRPPDPNGARVIPNLAMGLRLGAAPKPPERLVPEPPPTVDAKPEVEDTLPSVPVQTLQGAALDAAARRSLLKDLGFDGVPAAAAEPRELEEV